MLLTTYISITEKKKKSWEKIKISVKPEAEQRKQQIVRDFLSFSFPISITACQTQLLSPVLFSTFSASLALSAHGKTDKQEMRKNYFIPFMLLLIPSDGPTVFEKLSEEP